MLTKLLKYEFKSTYLRALSAFGVYAVLVAVMLIFFRNRVPLVVFFITVGIIALWVMTLINLFQRYNGNLYGSEGYLMFTLPVNAKKLLLSKCISALVWIILLGIVTGVTLLIMAACYNSISQVQSLISAIRNDGAEVAPYLVAAGVQVIFTLFAVYLSITVSKLPLWRKFGVVMGFVTFFVLDTIHGLPGLLVGTVTASSTINGKTAEWITSTRESLGLFGWLQAGYDIVLCVAMFYTIAYLMQKRTTLR